MDRDVNRLLKGSGPLRGVCLDCDFSAKRLRCAASFLAAAAVERSSLVVGVYDTIALVGSVGWRSEGSVGTS